MVQRQLALRQWRKRLGWWEFIATFGHGGGLGIAWQRSWYNGVTFFLGPLIVDIVPPPPKAMRKELAGYQEPEL